MKHTFFSSPSVGSEQGGNHAGAWLLALVTFVISCVSPAAASPITFTTTPSFATPLSSNGGGVATLTPTGSPVLNAETNANGGSLTLANASFQYSAVAGDLGKTVVLTYAASVNFNFAGGLSWTNGSYLQGEYSSTGGLNGSHGDFSNFSLKTEWSNINGSGTVPGTGTTAGQVTATPSNAQFVNNTSGTPANTFFFSSSFNQASSGSATLYDVFAVDLFVSAANEVFTINFPGSAVSNTEISSAPEPASLSMAGIGALALLGWFIGSKFRKNRRASKPA